ncbi:MAG: DUF6524 family protein [Woeseiaceae bacterium]
MADKSEQSSGGMSAAGFGLRMLASLVLVISTYNPSGTSAFHWLRSAIVGPEDFGPLHLLLIGVLLAGWSVFWIATWRSLGTLGVVLSGIIVGALIWLLFDIDLLESKSVSAITWIALFCLSVVLAVGVSWSHFWRRFTGQVNVEDVDD